MTPTLSQYKNVPGFSVEAMEKIYLDIIQARDVLWQRKVDELEEEIRRLQQ